ELLPEPEIRHGPRVPLDANAQAFTWAGKLVPTVAEPGQVDDVARCAWKRNDAQIGCAATGRRKYRPLVAAGEHPPTRRVGRVGVGNGFPARRQSDRAPLPEEGRSIGQVMSPHRVQGDFAQISQCLGDLHSCEPGSEPDLFTDPERHALTRPAEGDAHRCRTVLDDRVPPGRPPHPVWLSKPDPLDLART